MKCFQYITCLILTFQIIGTQARLPSSLSPSLLHQQSKHRALTRSRSRSLIHNLRGGGVQPSDASRGFWSTSTSSPTSRSPQPKSFQDQSRQRQHPSSNENPQVVVTDVTEDAQTKQRLAAKEEIDSFLTRESRNSFITRVYAILTGQLLMVALSVLGFARYPRLQFFMMTKGKFVKWAALFMSTTCLTVMSFSERARQSSPLKWQLLLLFTLGESIVVGFITSFYSTRTVLSAAMSTAVATMSVTMYTLLNRNPKRDLSQWGAGLSSVGMLFICYGVIHLLSEGGILPRNFLPYNEAIFSLFGTGLFTMYLAYHTRLIVSGKHTKYQLNEKDYVFGAVLLYNDIINIFLYLLRLLDDDRQAS
mmetsp:Transcript_3088/g.4669  ORF Transcript_3088/g.4669 Transcript_3088/m.4669 type:complete len:363 (+) Transcript_3088:86-1174(+)